MADSIRERGLNGNLQLLGRRSCAADVLLLTSKFEGIPNVLLEARYVGTPVVSTNAGGAAGAMLSGKAGPLSSKLSFRWNIPRTSRSSLQARRALGHQVS